MFFRRVLPLFFLLALFTSLAQSATWAHFDAPGARRTFAAGINNGGDVVGTYVSEDGMHAYRYRLGVFTTIDPPNAISAHAVGINDSGQISGWFQTSDQHTHGFRFDASGYTILDMPGASDTVAQGINNAGEIVGFYESGGTKGFKWTNGTFATVDASGAIGTEMRGVDNLHHYVGVYQDFNLKDHSFIQNGEGVFRDLPIKEKAYGINDQKVVVGSGSSHGLSYGFRYNVKTKKLVKMHFPGATETNCFGINNEGQITGNYSLGNGKVHGFVRTP